MKPLLIEIGVEELPANGLTKELEFAAEKYRKSCLDHGIDEPFSFDFTPRRLVFLHKSFPERQRDRTEILYGPPLENAVVNGAPTQAAKGFAKKCGVAFDQLGSSDQKGRKVLSYEKVIAGKQIDEILVDILTSFLASLNLGKTMRWSSENYEFSRPVRNLVVLHGDQVINCELFGVRSGNKTFVHRMCSFEPQLITHIDQYEQILADGGVILNSAKRREKILADFAVIEQAHKGFVIEKDADLLDEVVAITEYPTALIGRFDDHFLELPAEVIITVMKSHQRYFPVFDGEKLTNSFVVVSNAFTNDFSQILAGNEKVLRPRLSDALFFWNNDLVNGLQDEPLKLINYAEGVGTIYDKQLREVEIVNRLCQYLGISDQYVNRAASICKCDLATQMVYEFTELQGVMGMFYAQKSGENSAVATALYEQYLPLGEESSLPATQTGALLCVAAKIDTLMALFSINRIPTGSKDPFALRRAASAIIRIACERKWHIDISNFLALLADIYKPFDTALLCAFIKERLSGTLGANSSMIRAVLATGDEDIVSIYEKVSALENISKNPNFKENFAVFKRVANVLKDQNLANAKIDKSLFECNEENALFDAFNAIKANTVLELLDGLFALKPQLDAFFTAVMVNAENLSVRANRLSLMAAIYAAFLRVADIKEISF